jgi:hypothetical protein
MADNTGGGAAAAAAAVVAVEPESAAAVVDPAGEALLAACKANDLAAVKAAFSDGAEPHYQDEDGKSGLMIAAGAGFAEVVDLMLLKGAPWNGRKLWLPLPSSQNNTRFLLTPSLSLPPPPPHPLLLHYPELLLRTAPVSALCRE